MKKVCKQTLHELKKFKQQIVLCTKNSKVMAATTKKSYRWDTAAGLYIAFDTLLCLIFAHQRNKLHLTVYNKNFRGYTRYISTLGEQRELILELLKGLDEASRFYHAMDLIIPACLQNSATFLKDEV